MDTQEIEDQQRESISRWHRLSIGAISVARKSWPFVAGIAAALLGVWLYFLARPIPLPPTTAEIETQILDTMLTATPPPAYSAQVYQTILPSLVYIQTVRADSNPEEDGFGVGSGVVINEEGGILTSLHVVADAELIEIIFADGTRAEAEIVSADPGIDMALLSPNRPPELIVPAVLGNPSAMRIGDEAFAVGNPLGLPGSMSSGVISGFDRSLTPRNSDIELSGLIQFDAAVNPGNSGGPLLNRNGHVIGIVTALANPTENDFFIGIGFAVPIMTAVAGTGGGPNY